jgi:predicted peroxiredoxin
MAGTFCVTVTHCRTDGDKATLAFVVANAALGSEKDTMVFLSTDGVWCAVKGEAEKISVGAPFAPLKELMDKFLAGGGKILVCNPCMKKRSIDPRRHARRRSSPRRMALERSSIGRILKASTGCIL